MDLYTAGHRRGIAAAPHHAAAETGRLILAEGGNALEAMVAMAATIAAVYPHMNHIGGDGFWLVREPSGRVRALMGAGPAGAKATPALYREHGHDTIPPRGPLAALTVPGAIATWMLALEGARAHRGRLPLDVLLGNAIKHAQGYTVTRSQARLTAEKLAECKDAPGFAATFLVDGKPPAEGATLQAGRARRDARSTRQCGLAGFLSRRRRARDRGRSGEHRLAGDARRLSGYEAVVREPLSVALQAGTLYNTPPPTQGLASLMILALFERLRVAEAESFDHVHGIVEATKRAFRVRDRFVTDPERLSDPPARYLEKSFLDTEAQKIDRRKAARWPAPPGDGDTIWMGAADSHGLVVSYIQSLYWEFGSACVLPRTGVLMQNRGASFSLEKGAVNPLQPGRRPFHTLNPALAVLRDGRVMAYGAMGGDGQPQSQAALFTRHVHYRVPLEQAVDRPRWLLGRTWGSAQTNLRLESALFRGADRPAAIRRSRCRGIAGRLFRHDGPCRRGGAASGRHARRRARSARRRRGCGGLAFPARALPLA